jgi:SAM-dependent methyltransferase
MPEAETPERARLLARIRREFDVVEEPVAVGARTLAFARIADPDALLGDVCEQVSLSESGVAPKRELRMPYWAAVWESALALAQHLAERDAVAPLAGRRALDLGCGMGLVGAAMALLGARVTLGDVDTASLLFARLNTLAWADCSRVVRCDWHMDELGDRFDVIAGGDVLYDAEQAVRAPPSGGRRRTPARRAQPARRRPLRGVASLDGVVRHDQLARGGREDRPRARSASVRRANPRG